MILTGAKTLSYGANMQATRLAKAQGADEAVLVRPDGIVLEPPTSTVFWVTADGALRTPALPAGILDSITRRRLMEALETSRRATSRSRTCSRRARRSSPRRCERSSRYGIDGRAPARHGTRTQEARAADQVADCLASEGDGS